MNLQKGTFKNFHKASVPAVFGSTSYPLLPHHHHNLLSVRLPFQNTCWNLGSRQGCRKERAGCSMDLPTEFLSCLKSIQRSSSMRVRSPSSIPIYKDKFQPQPKARGSEVDATTNLLGAGMELKWRTPVFSQPRVFSGAAGGMPWLEEP